MEQKASAGRLVRVMSRKELGGEDWVLTLSGDTYVSLIAREALDEHPQETLEQAWAAAAVLAASAADGNGAAAPSPAASQLARRWRGWRRHVPPAPPLQRQWATEQVAGPA